MMIRKDILFLILLSTWAILDLICTLFGHIEYAWTINLIMIGICSLLVLLKLFSKNFRHWLNELLYFPKYKITSEREKKLWNSIVAKANKGYDEFWEIANKDHNYWGWIWMSPSLTDEEEQFLDYLHLKILGCTTYVVDSISSDQINYITYTEIKNNIVVE